MSQAGGHPKDSCTDTEGGTVSQPRGAGLRRYGELHDGPGDVTSLEPGAHVEKEWLQMDLAKDPERGRDLDCRMG